VAPDPHVADATATPEVMANGEIHVAEAPPAELPATTPEIEEPEGERPRSAIAEWMITILLLLFLTTTLVQAFVIPSGSMENTLLIGDHLLVDKLAYAPSGPISKYLLPYSDVKRGDIIVFRYPVDISQTYVKRCMGVPGDRIKLINKEVYLNGVKLNEPVDQENEPKDKVNGQYTWHKAAYRDDYRDNFPSEPDSTVDPRGLEMLAHNVVNGEVVVPPDSYFAMGDNRDLSWDSRYWGFVPRKNIIGKPLIIYWSYERPPDLGNSITVGQVLDLALHFFSKTRWNRTFNLIHGRQIP
jgi:signal peptidase I